MGKARILAVDDQRYFRELIEGMLRDEGYEVKTASSAAEALHVLEREDFEVVVTDLVMPEMDGAELVRKIKERRPDQDIVMVTGVVDVKTAVESMKQGATDYLLKPFDRAVLSDSIERILQRKRLRDEHARLMAENLEFMGVLSLFERTTGLFTCLSVEPLAERLLEGLCLETRAQSGVVWVAEEAGSNRLSLVGARGLVRVEEEPEFLDFDVLTGQVGPELETDRSVVFVDEKAEGPGEGESLFVPIRFGSDTIGLVRLADKLDGARFSSPDRATVEKVCEFGAIAVHNAMRFRALERRSLRDPDTRAYTQAYFEDAVRHEIQKADRFGHRFSMLRIELVPGAGGATAADLDVTNGAAEARALAAARGIEGGLRSTDLLASGDDGAFLVLLPQTDALGAGILGQRIRDALVEANVTDAASRAFVAAATFPADGTQLDGLMRVLRERIDQTHQSLLVMRPEFGRRQALDPLLDHMLELGTVEPVEVEGQILRFVLEDIVRRPADRGVLFVSPGARWLPEILETLEESRGRLSRTEVVLLAEAEEQEPAPNLTWITKSALDSRRPFVVYFGDGPAYAMVGQITLAADRTALLQTTDRALVEHLAFELQRELGVVISV